MAAEGLKAQSQQLVQAVVVFEPSSHWQPGPVNAVMPASIAPTAERRGPDRAKNVTCPAFKAKNPPAAAAEQSRCAAAEKPGTDARN